MPEASLVTIGKQKCLVPKFAGVMQNQLLPTAHSSLNSDRMEQLSDKHVVSEQLRSASVKERIQEYKNEQKIIKEALCNLDKVTSSKGHKVFGSESEDSGGEETGRSNSLSASSHKQSLFNDGASDEEEEEELEAGLTKAVRNAPVTQKMKQMESSFSGDRRFRMDDRFLGEFGASGTGDEAKDTPVATEQEQQKSVLEAILGKEIKPTEEKRERSKRVVLIPRFDPSNPEHTAKFALQRERRKSEEASVASSSESEDEVSSESEHENVAESQIQTESLSKDRFYLMDQGFAEEMKSRATGQPAESQGFSLLAAFGRETVTTDSHLSHADLLNTSMIPAVKPASWRLKLMGIRADSSDEAGSDLEEEPSGPEKKPKLDNVSDQRYKDNFFFKPDDPRIIAAVQSFRRTDSMEVVRKRWERQRAFVIKHNKRVFKELSRRTKRSKRTDGRS